MAETLKYLYMLQSPDHPISLERYVFNTVGKKTRSPQAATPAPLTLPKTTTPLSPCRRLTR